MTVVAATFIDWLTTLSEKFAIQLTISALQVSMYSGMPKSEHPKSELRQNLKCDSSDFGMFGF